MSFAGRSSSRTWPLAVVIAIAAWTSACQCGDPPEPNRAIATVAVEAEPSPPPTPTPARPLARLLVNDAAELTALDLSEVEALDLALSELDVREQPAELEPTPSVEQPVDGDTASSETGELSPPGSAIANPRCAGLDLHELAERAPKLVSLRISGCQAAVHAGLSAFGERLRELELVDLQLDAVTVARLSQLHGLETLSLTRVHAEPDGLKPLGRKISPQTVILRELAKDSPVAELLGILRDLREIRIIGPWATHTTMLQVGKAKRLERLAVLDTEIGNYSMHEIQPLEHLRRIEWSGPGFTDTSPVYLKELLIDELVLDCPRFGDKGLHHLYLLPNLRLLALERSAVTSAGLVELAPLNQLADLTLRYVDLDADGFAALAQLPALTRLVIGPGALLDPKATGLGLLIGLRELVIELTGFGDEAAPQLATLIALERLDLGETLISDEGLEHLAPLTQMIRLELHHTRVTKHGLAHLAGMQALEILELDHTDVVDEGVAHLSALASLRELRLDHTLITDAALPHIAKLSELERLNLAETVVTRQGVEALQGLEHLRSVNLAGTRP